MIARRWRILLVLVALVCVAQLVLEVLSRLEFNRIDDDAYMFVRYARNVLQHGSVSWNPGEAPTYGLTSLGWFAVILILQVVMRIDAAWVLTIATFLSGTGFVILALRMAVVAARDTPAEDRVVAVITVLLCLAWGARGLASHFVNGMDAAFAMSILCLVLMAALGWFRHPTTRTAVALGVLGGALLWVRPDILLFALVPPLMVGLLAPSPAHRRTALVCLATAAVTLFALAGIAWLGLGSPVPLPVYGKVLRGYGPDMQQVYGPFSAEQLQLFARDHAVALILGAVGVPLLVVRRGARGASLEIGLWLAAVLFVVFQRYFVLAIMGSHQRFYYPVLPVALFLAVRVVLGALQIPRVRRLASFRHAPRPTRLTASIVAVVLVVATLAPRMLTNIRALHHTTLFRHFDVWENYEHAWPADYWIRLDGFSRLPDDLVIATTEIGYPGVMNPDKRIVDLAGLNDREFARHGFSAAALFARERPDLFLLPRRHYAALRSELLGSAVFRAGYEVFTPPHGLILALRRDSRHFAAMRHVLGLTRNENH